MVNATITQFIRLNFEAIMVNATITQFIRLNFEAIMVNATITQFIRLQNLPSRLLKPLQAHLE